MPKRVNSVLRPQNSPVRVVTQKPMAYDSPDHIQPRGTILDNSVNLAFNAKLRRWMSTAQMRVLDLGCSGGGFVKSILEQGSLAIGIEGSDRSKLEERAQWATIPDHLFTADITEPFRVVEVAEDGTQRLLTFTVITAWEVMEHLRKDQLAGVARNIAEHLAPHGVAIMSISPNEEIVDGVRLHQTVESKGWWVAKFSELEFEHHEAVLRYFGDDWVRGGENAPGSFHLAMTRHGESLPNEARLLRLTPLVRCWDLPRRIGATSLRKGRKVVHKLKPARLKRSYDKRVRAVSGWLARRRAAG